MLAPAENSTFLYLLSARCQILRYISVDPSERIWVQASSLHAVRCGLVLLLYNTVFGFGCERIATEIWVDKKKKKVSNFL